MKKVNFGWAAFAVGVAVTLTSCGKNDTLDTQNDQRNSIAPALQGTWSTLPCIGQQQDTITVAANRMTVTRVVYGDKGCTVKSRTVSQGAKLTMMNDYKQGIDNAIVLEPDSSIQLTLHTDADVSTQNAVIPYLKTLQPQQATLGMSLADEANLMRENDKLAQSQSLTTWYRDQAKTLNNLQVEELNQTVMPGQSAGLNVSPLADFNSRLLLRYEVDNNLLTFNNGSGDFGQVFSK